MTSSTSSSASNATADASGATMGVTVKSVAAVYEDPITGFGSVIANGARFSESAATVADEHGCSGCG